MPQTALEVPVVFFVRMELPQLATLFSYYLSIEDSANIPFLSYDVVILQHKFKTAIRRDAADNVSKTHPRNQRSSTKAKIEWKCKN